MKKKYFYMILLSSFVIACSSGGGENVKVTNVSQEQVCDEVSSLNVDILLLDVRRQDEFTGPLGHLKNAQLIPVDDLEARIKEIEKFKDKKIIVYCRTGRRSLRASQMLVEKGFKDVNNLTGGMAGWNDTSVDQLKCKDELLVK